MFFGGIKYNAASDVLQNAAGEAVNLRRLSFKVFVYLMENADRVVSKDEILQAVWPGVVASEESLAQCIGDIRRVLETPAHDTLQTVPRRGFRLVPDPLQPKVGPQHSTEKTPQQTTNSQPGIVITQFEDLTGEPRWMRMAQGLTKNLVVELAKNSWLRILQLNHEEQLTDEMIAKANPKFVVSGSLQAEPGIIRITCQLKELPGHEVLWSEIWQKPAADLFSIQDEILQKINVSFGGAWTGIVAKYGLKQAKEKPTSSLDAYELYLLSIEHKHKFTPEDNDIAIQYLLDAVKLDPDFGLAWSNLFIVQFNTMDTPKNDTERLVLVGKLKHAASRAYQLLPNNPEVILAYGWLKAIEGDLSETSKQFERAVQLGWNNPDILAYAAWAGAAKVSLECDGIGWAERAMSLNPDYPEWYSFALAAEQYMYGQPGDAIESLKSTGDSFIRWWYEAGCFALLGDLEQAAEARIKALESIPHFTIAGSLVVDPVLDPVKLERYLSSMRMAGFP